MQQVFEWISQNQIIAGLFIMPLIGVIIRIIPKKKLMDMIPEEAWKQAAGKFMFVLGVTVSKFGNTKVGKKAMNKFEEGIIHTLVAIVMDWLTKLYNIAIHALLEFGKGLRKDNGAKIEKDT